MAPAAYVADDGLVGRTSVGGKALGPVKALCACIGYFLVRDAVDLLCWESGFGIGGFWKGKEERG